MTQGHRRIDAGTRREASAPDEDGSGRFKHFGLAPSLLDDEASTFSQAFQRADAFLFADVLGCRSGLITPERG